MTEKSADKLLSIGLSHHQAGRLALAEAAYQEVLREHPSQATTLNLLGALCIQTGRARMAVDLLDRAIALRSDVANYHSNLGEAHRALGQLPEAAASFREAIRRKPDLAVAHNNLGIVLAESEQLDEAERAYRAAIAIDPNYAEAFANLGNVLRESGQIDRAHEACQRAVQLKPGFAAAHNGLGAVLAEKGELEAAIDCYRRAVELNPQFSDATGNLANALAGVGEHAAAEAVARQAVNLQPDAVQLHWNLAVILLRSGQFSEGWREYEWRFRDPSNWIADRFDQPRWDGQPLAGRRLLLHVEQGFGDAIQFVRYARVAMDHGARVILECQKELEPLFTELPDVEAVVVRGQPLPAFEFHCPLMSMPLVCGTTMECIPSTTPYLFANPALTREWAGRIPARPAVGLVWSGSPTHSNDRNRSMGPEQLTPLMQTGATFASLQTRSIDGQQLPAAAENQLLDFTTRLTDFGETAALIEALDLVVTVDTAVAHLAGAMGKPVWVMLPYLADWRWLAGRTDSPWYPTMRLFRQRRRGDWESVVNEVAEALSLRVREQGTSAR